MLRKVIEFLKRKGGVIGTTFDDLWFFKTSFRARREGLLLTNTYTASVWAYRSIIAIAENITRPKLRFFRMRGDRKEEVFDSQLLRLFKMPNGDYSFRELLKRTQILMEFRGEAFWYLDRDNVAQLPREIRLLHPAHMRPVISVDGEILKWLYREKEELQPYEVIHFKYYNPLTGFEHRGLSPLDAVILSVENDYLASVFNRNFFEEGAVLSGFIKIPEPLTEEAYRRLRDSFENRHRGVAKAHRVAILEGGADFRESQITQRDMQFVDQKKVTREEIMTAFGTNAVVLGVYEDVKSYEGIKTAYRMFWLQSLIPRLKLLQDTLYTQLFAHWRGGEVHPEFDISEIEELQEEFEAKVKTAKTLWEMGYPINEINRRLELGLSDVPWGDSWWAPPTLMPMGEMKPQKSLPEPVTKGSDLTEELENLSFLSRFEKEVYDPLEEEWKKKLSAYLYQQRKRVLSALGSVSRKQLLTKDYIDIFFDEAGELRSLTELYEELYEKGIKAGVQRTAKELGLTGLAYEPLREELLGEMNMRISTIPPVVLRTIKNRLQKEITEGLVKGESINEIQDRVRKVYNMSQKNALRIARTETVASVMSGRMKVYEKAGVKKHMWLTAMDEHVRSSHARIHGEIRTVGEKFSNGLRFPGDPLGSADEVINCRCVTRPVVRDLTMVTPEPQVEKAPDFSTLLEKASPSSRAKLVPVIEGMKELAKEDARLVRVLSSVPVERIEVRKISEKVRGRATFEGRIIMNSLYVADEKAVGTLMHELTHIAQHKYGIEEKQDLKKFGISLPLLRDTDKIRRIYDSDEFLNKYTNSFTRVDEDLKKELYYAFKNRFEFQAQMIYLRAFGYLKRDSDLWKLTEEILDLIEEAQL